MNWDHINKMTKHRHGTSAATHKVKSERERKKKNSNKIHVQMTAHSTWKKKCLFLPHGGGIVYTGCTVLSKGNSCPR